MHSLTIFTATLASLATVTGHRIVARDGTVTVTVTTIPEYCLPSSGLATAMSPVVVMSGSTPITESVGIPVTPLSVPSTTEPATSLPAVAIPTYANTTASVPVPIGTAPTALPSANASVTTSSPSLTAESSVVSTSEAATSAGSTPASSAGGMTVNAGLLTAVIMVAGSFMTFA